MSWHRVLCASLLFTAVTPQFAAAAQPPAVFGWQEKSLIMPEQAAVDVVLDPAAANSSMAVQNLVSFQKDGADWVRFSVEVTHGLAPNSALTLERQVLRKEKGKNSFSNSQRQLVRMSLCVGDKVYVEDLALKTHEKGTSPVRLGRDMITDLGLVDASRTNTITPACKG